MPASSGLSPTSVQSKDTFGNPPHVPRQSGDMRWSEMVPPDSALAFAVLWDDEGDQMILGGAELHRSSKMLDRTKSVDGPLDVTDAQSQVLTMLTRSTPSPGTTGFEPRSATLARFQHAHLFPDCNTPSPSTITNGDATRSRHTQVSSTMDGLDVYIRRSMVGKPHDQNRHFSCFEGLDTNFAFDPRTSFDNRFAKVYSDTETPQSEEVVIDEGYFGAPVHREPGPHHSPTLPSVSSVATRSHLRQQSNPRPPVPGVNNHLLEDWRWSEVLTPTDPEALSSLRFASQEEAQRRRLRKSPRTDGSSTPSTPSSPLSSSSELPASPSMVLRRGYYNHELPLHENGPTARPPQPTRRPTRQRGFLSSPAALPTLSSLPEDSVDQPDSHIPFPTVSVPSSTLSLPKLVRGFSDTCRTIKSSLHPEKKEGWVYVETEVKVKQRHV